MSNGATLPVIMAFCVAAQFLGACAGAPSSPALSADARIRAYAARIAEHPRVYATYLGLSEAYLDKARETYDPAWAVKAQAAAQTSLDIAPSLEGYKAMARIAAFRHRFEETLEWSGRAADLLSADVTDGAVAALQVEALLGLGRYEEARAILPADGAAPNDFHVAAALGHWLTSQGRRKEAAEAYVAASRIAAGQGASSLAAWGQVMAAGSFLDSGNIQAAKPHLEAAAELEPDNRELRIHRAELLAAEGKAQAAIALYKKVLREANTPEIHHRIFVLARQRGDDRLAARHFNAAERHLAHVLRAGEVYALDELVRLYLDSGMEPEEARRQANGMLAATH